MSHTEIAVPCLNLYILFFMLLFNRVVLWDCDRSSNFFSSLPFCTLLWKLLRVFAQGSLKLNPPPPHTQTHTHAETFPISALPSSIPLSLSLYSLLSAQNYKSQTGVHTHTILLLTHIHTLTAHALSGTDSQCCTGVRQRCMIEREFILTPRQLKESTSVQKFHERMTSTEDLFYQTMEAKNWS